MYKQSEAIAFAEKLVEDSGLKDYTEIQEHIRNHEFNAIVDWMRDDDEWMGYTASKITAEEVELIDAVVQINHIPSLVKYERRVNNILYRHFYDNLADVNEVITDYLESMESYTQDDINKEINDDFEEQRA